MKIIVYLCVLVLLAPAFSFAAMPGDDVPQPSNNTHTDESEIMALFGPDVRIVSNSSGLDAHEAAKKLMSGNNTNNPKQSSEEFPQTYLVVLIILVVLFVVYWKVKR